MPSDEDLRFTLRVNDRSFAQGVVAGKRAIDENLWLRQLGHEEQRYATGLQRAARRREFIHGRSLLRTMLAEQGGKAMAAGEISTGRPHLLGDHDPPPALALTHSPGHLAAMVARHGGLGIDLEQVREDHDLQPTADYLGWGNWLRQVPPTDHWMWWTLWEASQKLQGQSVLTRDNPVFAQLLAARPIGAGGFTLRRAADLIAISSELADGVWLSVMVQADEIAQHKLALIWDDRLVPIPSP